MALGTSQTGAVIFGRNPEGSDVLLSHPSVSRRHAAVLHDGKGGLFLYEFGSTHGTFLDGRRIPAREAQPLREGSRVKFAESSRTYILRLPAAPAATMEPADTKEALEQLPLSFGGSKKTFGASVAGGGGGGGAGAMSKDAMVAGIAEMMKEIEAAETRRQEQEEAAANGKGQEQEGNDGEEEEEEEEDFGPAASSGTKDHGEAKAAAAAVWRARAAAAAEGEGDDDGDGAAAGKANGKAKQKQREEEQQQVEEAPESVQDMGKRLQVPMSHEVALRGHHKVSRGSGNTRACVCMYILPLDSTSHRPSTQHATSITQHRASRASHWTRRARAWRWAGWTTSCCCTISGAWTARTAPSGT